MCRIFLKHIIFMNEHYKFIIVNKYSFESTFEYATMFYLLNS